MNEFCMIVSIVLAMFFLYCTICRICSCIEKCHTADAISYITSSKKVTPEDVKAYLEKLDKVVKNESYGDDNEKEKFIRDLAIMQRNIDESYAEKCMKDRRFIEKKDDIFRNEK